MRVVMDSVGDVPASLASELQIAVVPVNIHFGEEAFLSGVTMDHEAFYRKVNSVTAQNFPKTAQPTPYQFFQCFQEILAEGETEILTVHVSHKLAGTVQSVQLAEEMLEGQGTFYHFDSMGGSAAQGYLAIEAARMARDGTDIEKILARLAEMRAAMVSIFTIDTLEYALKGGRVSFIKSLMASVLSIKPVMQLEDGAIVEAGRVRTRKKALQHIVAEVQQRVGTTPVKAAVIHAGAPEDAQTLQALASKRLSLAEIIVVDMSIAVAINLGPGALGLVVVPAGTS